MKPRHALIPLSMALLFAMPAQAQYCREFTQRILVGGRFQQGYGTSCLQPDGAWQITERANVREPSPVNFFYTPPAPVYVQPVQYYTPRPYYQPASVFNLSFGSNDRRWNRHCDRGYGRHDHGHGRGWGHGRW